MFDDEAHRDDSSDVTSLPSGATVSLHCDPMPNPVDDLTESSSSGNEDVLLLMLDEVIGCRVEPSVTLSLVRALDSDARSHLFPTRINVRSGDANARASFRKSGKALKEARDAMS